MTWLQHYNPLGNAFLSTVVAALPVVVLLGCIALLRIRVHFSALIGLAVALAIALLVYGMPVTAAAATTVYGAAFGLFPIGWIILNVIFLYQLTVERGLFAVLRDSLARVAPDPRVQLILIAFSFGAFIEGMAGFGTPVAITAAILIQLGFKPLHASGLALIANTAPVAFGSLGIPITTLEQVAGLDALKVSAMVGRQLPFFSLLIPFWIVAVWSGWRGMCGIWPAALTAGVAFAIPQFLVSNLHGPWLVDIIAGACSIAATVVLLRFWRPKTKWSLNNGAEGDQPTEPAVMPAAGRTVAKTDFRKETEPPLTRPSATLSPSDGERDGVRGFSEMNSGQQHRPNLNSTRSEVVQAWLPWAILTSFLLFWGLPQFKTALDKLAPFKIAVPHLHNVVQRVEPVAPPNAKPEKAEFRLNLFSATGTGILAAAIVAGFAMGLKPRRMFQTYLATIWRVRYSLVTIAGMLALGNVTKFSGTDATLGLAMAHTGTFYPFFGTLLGWLGVALTGSDTASNVLFGSLQRITAEQTGISPILMGAANSSGGVMGKMVDAQSIVVASTATNWYGHEGSILRYVFFHSIVLATMMGLLVFLQAKVWPFTLMLVK